MVEAGSGWHDADVPGFVMAFAFMIVFGTGTVVATTVGAVGADGEAAETDFDPAPVPLAGRLVVPLAGRPVVPLAGRGVVAVATTVGLGFGAPPDFGPDPLRRTGCVVVVGAGTVVVGASTVVVGAGTVVVGAGTVVVGAGTVVVGAGTVGGGFGCVVVVVVGAAPVVVGAGTVVVGVADGPDLVNALRPTGTPWAEPFAVSGVALTPMTDAVNPMAEIAVVTTITATRPMRCPW
jgi:hypothetical protein